jgi:hypothetical protein
MLSKPRESGETPGKKPTYWTRSATNEQFGNDHGRIMEKRKCKALTSTVAKNADRQIELFSIAFKKRRTKTNGPHYPYEK